MNSSYGHMVDCRPQANRLKLPNHEASMAQLLNIHNETFNSHRSSSNYSLENSINNNNSNNNDTTYFTYNPNRIVAKKSKNHSSSNASLNLSDSYATTGSSNNQQYQQLISTLERNYELNKQLKNKYLNQLNEMPVPQMNNSIYQNHNSHPIPLNQATSSLLPRKNYNQSGYSSDTDCYTNQLDQLEMARPRVNRHQIKSRQTLRSPCQPQLQQQQHQIQQKAQQPPNPPAAEFERGQFLHSRTNQRYKSLDRVLVNQASAAPLNWQHLNYYSSNQKLHTNQNKFFLLPQEPEPVADDQSQNEENLIESMNSYFLKWKTFNYEPEVGDHAAKRSSNSPGVQGILTSAENICQEAPKLTLTLPRRSRLSPTDPHSSSSEASFTDESKEFEVEFDRLSQLSSNMPMPMNNLFVGLPNADTKADVEPIVPLENALSNMNQILKNLAQTAEKKKNEYQIMQSVINDFEALKEFSPTPQTSTTRPPPTTISIPAATAQPATDRPTNNMSPSSSSSSGSSYAASSTKTLSRVSSASSSKTNSTCSSDFGPLEPFESQKVYAVRASLKDQAPAGERLSLGKKLKRFLSVNGSKRKALQLQASHTNGSNGRLNF